MIIRVNLELVYLERARYEGLCMLQGCIKHYKIVSHHKKQLFLV